MSGIWVIGSCPSHLYLKDDCFNLRRRCRSRCPARPRDGVAVGNGVFTFVLVQVIASGYHASCPRPLVVQTLPAASTPSGTILQHQPVLPLFRRRFQPGSRLLAFHPATLRNGRV